jgi:hypothetical protein
VPDQTLNIVNYIGSSFSIVGLIINIIIHTRRQIAGKNRRVKNSAATFMFKDLRSILIAFCYSLLAFNFFYLLSNIVTINISPIGSTVFAVLLHYSMMVSFLYMLSLGLCQYYVYNKTYTVIYNYTKISFILCTGIPLIPVIIMLAIDVKNYQQRVEKRYFSFHFSMYKISFLLYFII